MRRPVNLLAALVSSAMVGGAALAVPLFSSASAVAVTPTGNISTPAGVHVTSTSSGAVTLAWSPSTVGDSSGDVAAYYVLNGSTIVATSMGTSVTVSSLKPSTAYAFSVQAYDAAGSASTPSGTVSATTSAAPAASFYKTAYFAQWGVYGNQYYVSNVESTGVASKLSSLIYAFENIDPTNLTCFETIKASDTTESNPSAGDGAGDAYADYQSTNVGSVDGTAASWSQPLKGNFNQLRQLKVKHPDLKVLVSLGGWTFSKYFSDVAATAASRQKFVSSCLDLFIKGNLPTGIGGDASGGLGSAAGVFDGVDIDWEYPGTVGHTGNHVSPNDKANYTLLLQEFRTQLDAYGNSIGKHYLLTSAVPAGQEKLANIETNKVGNYLDYADVMTYDMHGAWDATGPTNLQDPLVQSPADPSTNLPPG
ncbi:MAG: chitinase, partial [Frankiaceae bacterium]|nr:chitinase [Frankiaceae bacterium]